MTKTYEIAPLEGLRFPTLHTNWSGHPRSPSYPDLSIDAYISNPAWHGALDCFGQDGEQWTVDCRHIVAWRLIA